MNSGLCDHLCPALMNDGRFATDYRPSCYVHDLITKQNQITNSYDLKQFLQHNAIKLQDINRDFYRCANSCNSCGGYYLPDPNNHIEFWDKYSNHIKYGNKMTFCKHKGKHDTKKVESED